jgi:hypothetical protein
LIKCGKIDKILSATYWGYINDSKNCSSSGGNGHLMFDSSTDDSMNENEHKKTTH